METVTAVELRRNLKSILQRVQAGEVIQVTYRGGPPVRIVAADSAPKDRMHGLDRLLREKRNIALVDEADELKKDYADHLDQKYADYVD